MKDTELKKLKDDLWHSADVLRAGAHLAANKYGQPILGLIFLRYADILYKQHKDEIEAEYNKHKGGRMEKSIKDIAIEKCGFFLPECAYYDYINNAPDDANKAVIVKKAMEAIEDKKPENDGRTAKGNVRSARSGRRTGAAFCIASLNAREPAIWKAISEESTSW